MRPEQKLIRLVKKQKVDAAERQRRVQLIADQMLTSSPCIQEANFSRIHPDDLRLLYDLYDDLYFDGLVRQTFDQSRISFRVSPRMTSAGGKTSRWGNPARTRDLRYEIAVSSTLLFQSFQNPDQTISVTGLECENRLQALLRVMEHELVHLVEMLLWTDSNCALHRFQDIASNQFGHTKHTHNLLTPREQARREYGVQAGRRVRFDFEGRLLEGVVNRVTKRATVLVQDPAGVRYSDGNHYLKYYVPVQQLEVVDG